MDRLDSIGRLSGAERWRDLSARLGQNDAALADEIRRALSPGVRTLLSREIAPRAVEGCVHAVIENVLSAIREGKGPASSTLAAFVLGFVKQAIADSKKAPTPEGSRIGADNTLVNPSDQAIVRQLLHEASSQERDCLMRYYFGGCSESDACAGTGFSTKDLRALRSRFRKSFDTMTTRRSGGSRPTSGCQN